MDSKQDYLNILDELDTLRDEWGAKVIERLRFAIDERARQAVKGMRQEIGGLKKWLWVLTVLNGLTLVALITAGVLFVSNDRGVGRRTGTLPDEPTRALPTSQTTVVAMLPTTPPPTMTPVMPSPTATAIATDIPSPSPTRIRTPTPTVPPTPSPAPTPASRTIACEPKKKDEQRQGELRLYRESVGNDVILVFEPNSSFKCEIFNPENGRVKLRIYASTSNAEVGANSQLSTTETKDQKGRVIGRTNVGVTLEAFKEGIGILVGYADERFDKE